MIRQFTIIAVICTAVGLSYAATDPNHRLNTTIVPSAYLITISPYFDTGDDRAFTFDGEVTITFTATSNINTIKLHSEDLIFNSSHISLTSGSSDVNLNSTNPLEFEKAYAFAHINLASDITPGEYNLKITYTGPIRTDLNGFYRNYYIENGVKKWLGATQMEPTHARKVFPSFDEPSLKATFTLRIDRPSHYKPSLANTKLESSVTLANGYIRDTFFPTPRMSTYLVAFLVSEFEGVKVVNGSNEIGVYTRPDALNQTDYTLDFAVRVEQALSKFYGIDYFSTNDKLKLDHIALLDFRAGAMENWGLVTYRESLVLYIPDDSTPYYKYRVAQIIAHETTHMWFGNLVTCHWWSNTWLNEGFANYFQDYITSMIEPEVGADFQLVIGSVYSAYDADQTPDSPAITNENVNSPAEISGHFGTITYQKAGSVIRMMHHLIEDDAFKFGLNAYLEANKFEPGYPEKLYSALHDGVVRFGSMAGYTSDLTTVMSSWISQAGHPLLHVEVSHGNSTITLTQKRFYIDPSNSSNEVYQIPITYTLDTSFDFGNTKPAFIMTERKHVLEVKEVGQNHSWPIFNIQETGLYRVNYDSHTWEHISSHLKGEKREQIHYYNRAKIVNDLFAFLQADEVKFELLNDVLQFLENETHYTVCYAAIRGLNRLRNYFLGSEILGLIDEFALGLMKNIIEHVGYEVKNGEDYATQRNRMQVLEFACKLGHEGCLQNTLSAYTNFKTSGKWIHPSLRTVAYCTGLRFGTGEDYDFLWNRMSTTNVANEARLIGDILGCSSDETKLNSYLFSMLVENSPIKTQDLTVPLSSVLSNYSNVHVVLESLRGNISLWNSVYPSMDSVLSTVASALHTEEEFRSFESWLSSCSECSESSVASARAALAKARSVTTWADNHTTAIRSVLRNDARMLSASSMVIAISAFVIMYGNH